MQKISTKKNPLDVVCPKCHAAVTAQCLTKVRDGSQFINAFHQERIDLANASVANTKKPELSKSMYP